MFIYIELFQIPNGPTLALLEDSAKVTNKYVVAEIVKPANHVFAVTDEATPLVTFDCIKDAKRDFQIITETFQNEIT